MTDEQFDKLEKKLSIIASNTALTGATIIAIAVISFLIYLGGR